ncbi:hypothetical protein GCM10017774_19900 [Lentzea cavernae]|uniref:Uncharacterized protein n=1 Tax=Lentzea cavernae TaxID=2020703 RepID=A0ABQ3M8D3_9PSEU|nr:hypothetical protein GCM10017774_19900 [Lentzea cavernae]
MTSEQTATTHTPASTRLRREWTSHNTSGITHSQWWLHEIGETSNPKNCTVTTAAGASPARTAARNANHVSPADTATASSHGQDISTSYPSDRDNAPRNDWLITDPTGPTRSAAPSSSNQ